MPLIEVKLIENMFTPAQKCQIITKLTEAMVSIEGENIRPSTSVVIREMPGGNCKIGGQALTTGDMRASVASFFAHGCT
jgi:4-oxalocrotonate tautomerase